MLGILTTPQLAKNNPQERLPKDRSSHLQMFYKILKFCKIHRKNLVLESLFNNYLMISRSYLSRSYLISIQILDLLKKDPTEDALKEIFRLLVLTFRCNYSQRIQKRIRDFHNHLMYKVLQQQLMQPRKHLLVQSQQ